MTSTAPRIGSAFTNGPVGDAEYAVAAGLWREEFAHQVTDDRDVRNRSGIPIEPMYTPENWSADQYLSQLGYPGQHPYTRGIYPSMYRGRTWTQRQLIGLGTPEDYNRRVRQLLDLGANAISLLPCNSGFRGVDCDAVPLPLLGTCGTVINTVEHMDAALHGVPLDGISTASRRR